MNRYHYNLISAYETGLKDHPQKVIESLGFKVLKYEGFPIADSVWIETDKPIKPLPSYLTHRPHLQFTDERLTDAQKYERFKRESSKPVSRLSISLFDGSDNTIGFAISQYGIEELKVTGLPDWMRYNRKLLMRYVKRKAGKYGIDITP